MLVLTLPVKDAEGQNVTTTFYPSSSFISLAQNTLTISPSEISTIRSNILELTLSDGILNTSYKLNITVINTAPLFYEKPKDIKIH